MSFNCPTVNDEFDKSGLKGIKEGNINSRFSKSSNSIKVNGEFNKNSLNYDINSKISNSIIETVNGEFDKSGFKSIKEDSRFSKSSNSKESINKQKLIKNCLYFF
jgi:hypothetical protein